MRWWCRVLTCYTNSSNSYLMCCVNTVPCNCCSMEASQQSRSRSHLCYWLPSQMDTACCIRNNDIHSSGLNGSQQIPGSLQEYRHWKNFLCFSCMSICKAWSELATPCLHQTKSCMHLAWLLVPARHWHGLPYPTQWAHTIPNKIHLVLMRFIFYESHQKELIMCHFLSVFAYSSI